jgi:hypothetical protein
LGGSRKGFRIEKARKRGKEPKGKSNTDASGERGTEDMGRGWALKMKR